jgi:hypothetical protein
MNKLVYSALALTLVSAPGFASENEWSSLDQEIESLSSSLSTQNATGPKINGWVISSFRHSSDVDADPDPTNEEDQSGFFLESVRVEISGDAGSDYSYKVSFELSEGVLTLRDAYATFRIADAVNGRMGNFKQPFLRSALISDNRLLFLDRTFLGGLFASRDLGLMFFGSFDTLDWYIAAQNGSDGVADEFLFTGRLAVNLMGNGTGKVEGAYGAGDEANLSVGAAVADDGATEDGLHWALEAAFAQGPFSVAGEIVDFDDGIDGTDFFGTGDGLADTTPWDVTASYMFTDMYELAVRYQDFDDDDDSRSYGAVINRYVQGHDIKWLLQYQKAETDAAGVEDIDEIGLGLAVSF